MPLPIGAILAAIPAITSLFGKKKESGAAGGAASWLPSAITAGGGLLGGLFGGIQTAKERKRAKQDYMELLGKRIGMVKGEFKPTQARYNIEKDLPAWDEFMKKAVMGSYGTAFGQEGAEMPSAADFMSQMFTPPQGGMPPPGMGGGGGMPVAMGDMMRRRRFGRMAPGDESGYGGGGFERY